MAKFKILLLLSVLCATPLAAQTPAEAEEFSLDDKQFITEMVNAFSRCSAFFEVAAALLIKTGHPATGEGAHQQANGAYSSALYLLGLEHAANGKEPKPNGSFAPYVDGIVETETVRLVALIEANEQNKLMEASQKCVDLDEVQAHIVQLMRNEFVGR